MKIVAFMQNMWVRDPARVAAGIARHGEQIRRRYITAFLFNGCLTGRRLKQYLGDLTEQIVWEEASREVTSTASAKVTADLGHIGIVLIENNPDLVISFGKIASDALKKWELAARAGVRFVYSPHPAARNQLDQSRFREAMQQVVKLSCA